VIFQTVVDWLMPNTPTIIVNSTSDVVRQDQLTLSDSSLNVSIWPCSALSIFPRWANLKDNVEQTASQPTLKRLPRKRCTARFNAANAPVRDCNEIVEAQEEITGDNAGDKMA